MLWLAVSLILFFTVVFKWAHCFCFEPTRMTLGSCTFDAHIHHWCIAHPTVYYTHAQSLKWCSLIALAENCAQICTFHGFNPRSIRGKLKPLLVQKDTFSSMQKAISIEKIWLRSVPNLSLRLLEWIGKRLNLSVIMFVTGIPSKFQVCAREIVCTPFSNMPHLTYSCSKRKKRPARTQLGSKQ